METIPPPVSPIIIVFSYFHSDLIFSAFTKLETPGVKPEVALIYSSHTQCVFHMCIYFPPDSLRKMSQTGKMGPDIVQDVKNNVGEVKLVHHPLLWNLWLLRMRL